jgi:hypothetical protein
MRAYILDPRLTLGSHECARRFFEACRKEIERHVETTCILSEAVMFSATPTADDVLLLFNRADQNYSNTVVSFFERVLREGCTIFPVAMTEDHRDPPFLLSDYQSYDVPEQLRQRKLTPLQMETIATALARTVVARLQPTLSKDNMYLFLSYRRVDGEQIAGAFHDELCVRMQRVFRDLNSVLVGQESQDVILKNLRLSDVVVFFDTPRCAESEWVALELRSALAMNIPIVWIRVGAEDSNRPKLKVTPGGEPHFRLTDVDMNSRRIDSELVDQVIAKAFEISREHANTVFSHLERLRALHQKGVIRLSELNKRYMTYHIEIPRPYRFRYRQRPMIHIVGFYGRIPKPDDRDRFLRNVEGLGYLPHRLYGYHYYDCALMLAPVAPQSGEDVIEGSNSLVDSCAEYVASVENYIRGLPDSIHHQRKGVIISGAFPDCEPEHQQHVTDAVHAFTQAILDRGGTVIFGAHPTFQHLIFDLAKQRRTDYKAAVHMYVSRYFVTDAFIEECRQKATVTPIDAVDGDRQKSLTAMRQAMIRDEEALCLVAIGGKTHRPDLPPGVDEEIDLAKARGIPVFMIGSAGGRTAELAAEFDKNGWKEKLNRMSDEFNRELMVSLDYHVLANRILDHIGL